MKRETIVHANEADWLEDRKKFITSTDVAALFNAGAFIKTEFELFHLKAGNIEAPAFTANERVKWGSRLESVIAYGVAEDLGLIVEPFKSFMTMPETRLAASFDFKIIGVIDGFNGNNEARRMFAEHGPGLLEIKNIDSLQFKRGWIEDGETIEAPVQYEFQVQTQMEVADLNWAILAPLVGGNTPKTIIRTRDKVLGDAIHAKVRQFWARIETNTPPKPDYVEDADTISKLYVDNDGSSRDLSDNFRLIQLCQEYKAAAADEKDAKERKSAAKAEILTIIEATKTVKTVGYKISAGTNKEVFKAFDREAGERWTITRSVVPAAHIESITPAFRNVRITEAA
jgi:predicted phage-related endonuclease